MEYLPNYSSHALLHSLQLAVLLKCLCVIGDVCVVADVPDGISKSV